MKNVLLQLIVLLLITSKVKGSSLLFDHKHSDSTFFSLVSRCNFIIKFNSDAQSVVQIDNQKIQGVFRKIKNDQNHYNFYSKDSLIFTVKYNEGFFITNQNYEHRCESAKAIILYKKGDPENEGF